MITIGLSRMFTLLRIFLDKMILSVSLCSALFLFKTKKVINLQGLSHCLVMTIMKMYTILHCKEISTYVFPEKELRGLSPNFHHHVYVSDLYIPTINRQIDHRNIINRPQKRECWNWDCGRAVPFLGIFVFNFRYCVFTVHVFWYTLHCLKNIKSMMNFNIKYYPRASTSRSYFLPCSRTMGTASPFSIVSGL